VTYWIATGCRIVFLTVFVKSRVREDREIDRARRALARCIAEEHMAEEGIAHALDADLTIQVSVRTGAA
jgi:hypothetical protein